MHFLDDLLSVDHKRLASVQAHAEQEKNALVQKLEDIRCEMEKRMEEKSSEAEKRRVSQTWGLARFERKLSVQCFLDKHNPTTNEVTKL